MKVVSFHLACHLIVFLVFAKASTIACSVWKKCIFVMWGLWKLWVECNFLQAMRTQLAFSRQRSTIRIWYIFFYFFPQALWLEHHRKGKRN